MRRTVLLSTLVLLVFASCLSAQVGYYRVLRTRWSSQVLTNPVPVNYRFSAMIAGSAFQSSQILGLVLTNSLLGGAYQMSFGTNFPAFSIAETNLNGGLDTFNTVYPATNYRLKTLYQYLSFSRTNDYLVPFTNDFPATAPVFTNVLPVSSLDTNQLFQWPVFATDTNHFASFYLLEGHVDTNMISQLVSGGVSALTNELSLLYVAARITPTQNWAMVSNLNPALDHLGVLEFHHTNPTTNDITRQSEVGNVLANAVFFFALRVLSPPASKTVEEGEPVTMTVAAAGARPLTYQWRHQGADISSATNAYYLIPAAHTNHAGEYSVVVYNPSGSVTSAPGVLTISASTLDVGLPRLVGEGNFQFSVGGPASQTVTIEGTTTLTNWTEAGIILLDTNGLGTYQITNAFGQRFFRARLP